MRPVRRRDGGAAVDRRASTRRLGDKVVRKRENAGMRETERERERKGRPCGSTYQDTRR
jgi:hypothetical protein